MPRRSLLSGARTLDEFIELRFRHFSDAEDFYDLDRLIKKGELSLTDPLGCLLTIGSFSGEPMRDFMRCLLERVSEGREEETIERWKRIQEVYRLTDESSSSYFQTLTEEEDLKRFVDEWYKTQSDPRIWNPAYAPPLELTPEIINFCGRNLPEAVLQEFKLYPMEKLATSTRAHYDDEDEFTKPNSSNRKNYQALIYPIDGFNLAECLRLSYEFAEQSRKTQAKA